MPVSALALCVAAFVTISAWLFIAPRRSQEDDRETPGSLMPNKNNAAETSHKDIDLDDILKRAPCSPGAQDSRGTPTHEAANASSSKLQSDSSALDPSDPAFHTQHLDQYDFRPALDLRPSGMTAKSALHKGDSTEQDKRAPAKSEANGRSVQFSGAANGTAATMIASRPAEEAEQGADLRLWDESQDLEDRIDQHRVREPSAGQPALLNAMDGSCSPLRLRPGIMPPNIAATMQDIEDFCSRDWMRPMDEDDGKAWAKLHQDIPHPIFGNAPYWISAVIRDLVVEVPHLADTLPQLLESVISTPPDRVRVFSPTEIISRSQDVTHDLLLTFFMVPFRVYVDQEWGEPDRLDKRGDPNGKMHFLRDSVGEIAANAIEWLHYIARPFLVSRMFAGRSAEILDDSVRIGIFANASLRGYIAEVTVFAPCPTDDEELQVRGWQVLRANKGEMVKYALGRCLNLARDWIEYRFADPSGVDRFGYQSGGDPIVWTRLVIRPGHILHPDSLEANINPEQHAAVPKPNASAHPIELNQSSLQVLLRQHLDSSVPIFRNIVLMLRPHRLSFNDYRQNAWHSEVRGNEQFDEASFAFMWMLCSLGLKYEANPGLKYGEDVDSDISEIIGKASTFRQLDLGGILPYFGSPTKQFIDLGLFPSVTKVVIPYIPLNDGKLSTASLVIDEH